MSHMTNKIIPQSRVVVQRIADCFADGAALATPGDNLIVECYGNHWPVDLLEGKAPVPALPPAPLNEGLTFAVVAVAAKIASGWPNVKKK